MINNRIRKTTLSKEKFRYSFLMEILENADSELIELEQKYNIIGTVASGSLIRIATMPDEYIDDIEFTDEEKEEIIKEIHKELNYKIDRLARW